MEPLTVRTTFNYTLHPTAEQEGTLALVLRRCSERYNAALQERQEAWRKCAVHITTAGQRAQVPEINQARPDYRAIHAQGVQDVLTRVDRAYLAVFGRVQHGETPGDPRLKSNTRSASCTSTPFGNGATLDTGLLVLSKIGRSALRWSRPLEGTPKTVTLCREADGWYACCCCAQVPVKPLPLTGQQTGASISGWHRLPPG